MRTTDRPTRRETWLWLCAFVALSLLPLSQLGPTFGSDTQHHVVRAEEVFASMREGNFNLVFSEAYGRARMVPTYVYYSQWIYWPIAALMFCGLGSFVALKCCYGALIVVLVTGTWRVMRARVSAGVALTATLIFVTSSYVVANVFIRGAYAEAFASAFVPWAMFLMGGDRRKSDVALVLVLAVIVLSHPLTMMNCIPVLVAHHWFWGPREKLATKALGLVLPLAWALTLTAFFWGPAMVERKWVWGASWHWSFPRFAPFAQLSAPVHFKSTGWPLLIAVAVASLLFARQLWLRQKVLAAVGPLGCVILYGVLLHPSSLPLWTAGGGLLKSNLFTWRMLFPASLAASLFVAAVLEETRPPALLSRALCLVLLVQGVMLPRAAYDASGHLSAASAAAALESIRMRMWRSENGWGVNEYVANLEHVPLAPRACRRPTPIPHLRDGTGRFRVRSAESIRAGTQFFLNRHPLTFDLPASFLKKCVVLPLYWSARHAVEVDGAPATVFADRRSRLMVLAPNGKLGEVRIESFTPPHVGHFRLVSLIAAALGLMLRAWGTRATRLAIATHDVPRTSESESGG